MIAFALLLAASPCTSGVCFVATSDDRSATLRAENRSAAPAVVRVELTLENATSSAGNSFQLALAPHQSQVATRITTRGGPWKYHYDFKDMFGDAAAVHDRDTIYSLPFAPRTFHKVLQGENGTYTHQGDSAFAYDFEMAEGTAVLAAREGVVIDVRSDQTEHGETAAFDAKANFIYVLHADGTIGQYLHLKPGGVRVAVGDTVARGQPIGFSGNTGHSKGPHLHFEVNHRVDATRRQTVPVKFAAREGSGLTIKEGESYTAVP